MSSRPDVLVHGAAGRVGRLLCLALRKRGVGFDIAGVDRSGLEALARSLGTEPGVYVVDPASAMALSRVVAGRRVIAACGGPFFEVGRALLDAATEAGAVYVDTSGEQSWVRHVLSRDAAAEAREATLVPSTGALAAVADWLAARAITRLGGDAPLLSVCYAHDASFLRSASPGVWLAASRELSRPDALQFVDGVCVRELPMVHDKRFIVRQPSGARREVTAVSYPGPESLLLPSHTGARTVRTYIALPGLSLVSALAARVTTVIPWVAGAASRLLSKRAPRDGVDAPAAAFEVIVEAARGGVSAIGRASGVDPYRIAGEMLAHAVAETLEGRVAATGAAAPSVAFDAERALAMLESHGVTLEVTDRSRER